MIEFNESAFFIGPLTTLVLDGNEDLLTSDGFTIGLDTDGDERGLFMLTEELVETLLAGGIAVFCKPSELGFVN